MKPGRKKRIKGKRVRLQHATPLAPADELTIPSRWVKSVAAVFLLPLCWISTKTFFSAFTRATFEYQFWASEEFWFFSLGVVLWMIAFFGLPRPLLLYVFGHELTHAIWVWLMGGRVSAFHVSRDGGHIITDRSNFLISLSPYFFPIYAILFVVLYGVLGIFWDLSPYAKVMYGLVGAAWAFHLCFTCVMIPKGQSDLTEHGMFFSLVVIYLMNLLLLSLLLILASPEVSLGSFGQDWVWNASDFSFQLQELIRSAARIFGMA